MAKRIKLARLLRKLGFPCRAAAYISAAQRNLGKLPARDKRYYLYDHGKHRGRICRY